MYLADAPLADSSDLKYWLTAGIAVAITATGAAVIRIYRQSRKAKTDADQAEVAADQQNQFGQIALQRSRLEVRASEMELLEKYQGQFIETLQGELTTLRAQLSTLQEESLKRLIAAERHANECEVRLASLEERNRHLEERLRALEAGGPPKGN